MWIPNWEYLNSRIQYIGQYIESGVSIVHTAVRSEVLDVD